MPIRSSPCCSLRCSLRVVTPPPRTPPTKVSRPGEYRGYAAAQFDGHELTSQYVAVRDGTRLAIDMFRPDPAAARVADGQTSRRLDAHAVQPARHAGWSHRRQLPRQGAAAREVRLCRRRRGFPRPLRLLRPQCGLQPRRMAGRRALRCLRHHRVAGRAALQQRQGRHVGLLGHRRQPDAGAEHRAAASEGHLPDELRVGRVFLGGRGRHDTAAGRSHADHAWRAARGTRPRGRGGGRGPTDGNAAAARRHRRARGQPRDRGLRAVPRQRLEGLRQCVVAEEQPVDAMRDAINKSGIAVYAATNWAEGFTGYGPPFTFNNLRHAEEAHLRPRQTLRLGHGARRAPASTSSPRNCASSTTGCAASTTA